MSIAVISDLHLGARPSTDLFGHDDGEFLRFLTFLERNFERIVLLGDIWETLTSTVPYGHIEELRQARERHRELAHRLKRPQYTYIHGNHDMVAGRTEAAPSEVKLESHGVRFLFTHGHQSDPLVMKTRPVSETGVWLGGWIRRAGLQSAYRFFAQLDRKRSYRPGKQHVLKACLVESWAVQHARRSEADVVVTGHTHVARRAEHGNQLFLNSGSCSSGKISFLSLDPRTGSYEVKTSF